jgi:hypothetical protein
MGKAEKNNRQGGSDVIGEKTREIIGSYDSNPQGSVQNGLILKFLKLKSEYNGVK